LYIPVDVGVNEYIYGFKLHFVCNDRGEIISFVFTPANTDDRSMEVFNTLKKKLFGKLYGDRGYISSSLVEMLFQDGVHLVTGIKSNMKNRLMSLYDRIMLRKRSVIETINDELKNICDIEHSRHRSVHNFFMNLIAAIAAYNFFDKKPSIRVDFKPDTSQLALFYESFFHTHPFRQQATACCPYLLLQIVRWIRSSILNGTQVNNKKMIIKLLLNMITKISIYS
jgi:hypothetical protein